MQVSIQDRAALQVVTPAALSVYARIAGWRKHESYRDNSDVYIGDTLPEIIVPRTARLGDYASAVAALIEAFAQVAEQDELTVYRSLVTADRDVIRIRAAESADGSLGLNDGVSLVQGARAMVHSATCSLHEPRPVYRLGANQSAVDLMRLMRLGQTDQDSFVVTLLTPVMPPPMQPMLSEDDPDDDPSAPIARQMTRRLVEALDAARKAVERVGAGDADAFGETVANGVSANLCESLVQIVEPFPTLDVGVSWAHTRPMAKLMTVVRFGQADAPLLKECARSLRAHDPQPDVLLHGFVRILERGEDDIGGTIRLKTDVDGRPRSVLAVLEQSDYEQAVQAHKERSAVKLKGDLERAGQRWRLLNPRIKAVLRDDRQE